MTQINPTQKIRGDVSGTEEKKQTPFLNLNVCNFLIFLIKNSLNECNVNMTE